MSSFPYDIPAVPIFHLMSHGKESRPGDDAVIDVCDGGCVWFPR